MKTKYLEKAAQQILAEVLGYDEGRTYYLLLIKQEKKLDEEFSYSKKYRLLKSLYELGAVGKIKSKDKDFFSYVLLPPTFLYKKADKEIVEYLEKLYLENFSWLFKQDFSQFIMRDEKSFLMFLLKYFMKEEAKLMGDFDKSMLEKDSKKINIVRKEKKRRAGIIDKNLFFEFVSIKDKEGYDNIGYITRKIENKNYYSKIEDNMY